MNDDSSSVVSAPVVAPVNEPKRRNGRRGLRGALESRAVRVHSDNDPPAGFGGPRAIAFRSQHPGGLSFSPPRRENRKPNDRGADPGRKKAAVPAWKTR